MTKSIRQKVDALVEVAEHLQGDWVIVNHPHDVTFLAIPNNFERQVVAENGDLDVWQGFQPIAWNVTPTVAAKHLMDAAAQKGRVPSGN